MFVESISQANFDEKFEEIYLSNPCQKLNKVLNFTEPDIKLCESVALGK